MSEKSSESEKLSEREREKKRGFFFSFFSQRKPTFHPFPSFFIFFFTTFGSTNSRGAIPMSKNSSLFPSFLPFFLPWPWHPHFYFCKSPLKFSLSPTTTTIPIATTTTTTSLTWLCTNYEIIYMSKESFRRKRCSLVWYIYMDCI